MHVFWDGARTHTSKSTEVVLAWLLNMSSRNRSGVRSMLPLAYIEGSRHPGGKDKSYDPDVYYQIFVEWMNRVTKDGTLPSSPPLFFRRFLWLTSYHNFALSFTGFKVNWPDTKRTRALGLSPGVAVLRPAIAVMGLDLPQKYELVLFYFWIFIVVRHAHVFRWHQYACFFEQVIIVVVCMSIFFIHLSSLHFNFRHSIAGLGSYNCKSGCIVCNIQGDIFNRHVIFPPTAGVSLRSRAQLLVQAAEVERIRLAVEDGEEYKVRLKEFKSSSGVDRATPFLCVHDESFWHC
jgi:hypothetical protein